MPVPSVIILSGKRCPRVLLGVCARVWVRMILEFSGRLPGCVNRAVLQHLLRHCLWQLWSYTSRTVLTEPGPRPLQA